ncbi:MAG: LLM class flavin-dependent oxidoreductase [Chloroflexi bacterium]|nr:LLM class flavin-dependent oxidoreductase [Chloroflexota bacterium]MYD49550.1 LLM class flavin-dependent oxidoreductase [Chloroflexota bacterium]
MKLGLFNMPLHPPGRRHADTYDEDLELMAYADELGYAEAWIGEHFTTEWENMPAPELFIARALGVTRNLVMGTGVSLLAFHDPIMIAHRMAMLDHLARGRFFFGIGSGGVPTDSEMFRQDRYSGQQRNRMREAAELIVKMWTDDDPNGFHFQGEYYDVKVPAARPEMGLAYHMRPYQQPHPPIAVAGSSPSSQTLEVAGELGWWPMSTFFLHASNLPLHWEAYCKGAKAAGRAVSRTQWRIAREVYVGETTEQAVADVMSGPPSTSFTEYFLPLLGQGLRGLDGIKTSPDLPNSALTPEYMLENFWIAGDPDECARQIRQLYEDTGGFGTLLILCHDWGADRAKGLRSLELLATETLPQLADLTPVG